ncbi:MAG: hypothetical protein ACRD0P_00920 [Stackebrandtia sp.]
MDTSLYDLKNVGRVNLPLAANQYSLATTDLYGIDSAGAFPPEVTTNFVMLHESVQNMLADIGEYLIDAGTALVQCADDYAATDQGAADALRECEKERTEHEEAPKTVPAPVRPGANENDNAPLFPPREPDEERDDTVLI